MQELSVQTGMNAGIDFPPATEYITFHARGSRADRGFNHNSNSHNFFNYLIMISAKKCQQLGSVPSQLQIRL